MNLKNFRGGIQNFLRGPLAAPPLACLFVRKIKSEGPDFRKSAGGVGWIEKIRKGPLYKKSSVKGGNHDSDPKTILVLPPRVDPVCHGSATSRGARAERLA
jgi:hypothetical protein